MDTSKNMYVFANMMHGRKSSEKTWKERVKHGRKEFNFYGAWGWTLKEKEAYITCVGWTHVRLCVWFANVLHAWRRNVHVIVSMISKEYPTGSQIAMLLEPASQTQKPARRNLCFFRKRVRLCVWFVNMLLAWSTNIYELLKESVLSILCWVSDGYAAWVTQASRTESSSSAHYWLNPVYLKINWIIHNFVVIKHWVI